MKFDWYSRPEHERKRIIELVLVVSITFVLVSMSRLETRLLELSKNLSSHQDFFTSIVYFGQINFNVILILVLSGLVFRNIARLVVERKRGIIGSRLKTKLVISFVFFAGAPTILMFYISYRFITDSFDKWFSVKVQETIQQTREAGARVYRQDQRRVESLARIALQRVHMADPIEEYPGALPIIDSSRLEGFDNEYRLDAIKVFDRSGRLIWKNATAPDHDAEQWDFGEIDNSNGTIVTSPIKSIIERFIDEPGLVQKGMVENQDQRDIVRGIAPVYEPRTHNLIGVVVAEEHFEAQILRSIEAILSEFANLRPGAQLIRLSYVVLLVAMLFLIMFAATWLGFYVARVMTGPIQELAEGAQQVATGNYEVTIPIANDDETGQLIKQFNLMTKDLRRHRTSAEESETLLRRTNEELERRRNYMEIILNNINTGVISVDADGVITSASSAGRELLQMGGKTIVGLHVSEALSTEMYDVFWRPIAECIELKGHYSGQMEMEIKGRALSLIIDASRFEDDVHRTLGIVVVFDDATERVRAQRVAAWREVARRIAHEIKNPITPIKLNAQRLARRFGKQFQGDDQVVFTSCIDAILSQVESLRRMVNEFSKFSRMPTVLTKSEDFNALIVDIVNIMSISHPDITFDVTDLCPNLPFIHIDREQVGRAIVNVFSNAIDAMKSSAHKVIKIKTIHDSTSSSVQIEVADTGPGFPVEIIDRVIEPYVSTKKEGTGLGLPIVNQIVSEHGGYLRVRNDGGEMGAVVILQFPIGTGPSASAETTNSLGRNAVGEA